MSLLATIKPNGPSGFGYGSTAEGVTAGLSLDGRSYLLNGLQFWPWAGILARADVARSPCNRRRADLGEGAGCLRFGERADDAGSVRTRRACLGPQQSQRSSR
jgi:hypothetical protein